MIQMKIVEVKQQSEMYTDGAVSSYLVRGQTALSTQEFSIGMDHNKREIWGDAIRYGSWDDLSAKECREVVAAMIEFHGPLDRSIEGYDYPEPEE